MDDAEKIYEEGKLLIRAMDPPIPRIKKDKKYFECFSWIDEFNDMMNDGLNSLSTTLVIPGVGVKNYKNLGFLVNSDLANCFHLAKEDSGSSGSIRNGDFWANPKDFDTISEMANYIKENNAIVMNEVNINIKLDAVVGLFINKCLKSNILLKRIYVVKKLLEHMTGIDYPVYLYDWNIGRLEKIELSKEQEDDLIASLENNQIYYWPNDSLKATLIPIETSGYSK